jgi:hypothetical protein
VTVADCGVGRVFWPVGEAAQADYEALRLQALTGEQAPSSSLSAARFARRGLAGLIAWPASEPVFTGPMLGGTRPRWRPHDDPRLDALAAGFAFLLGVDSERATDMMEGLVR